MSNSCTVSMLKLQNVQLLKTLKFIENVSKIVTEKKRLTLRQNKSKSNRTCVISYSLMSQPKPE